jgi:pyruvate dehydrogenase E2 component (dihydrolipoamide acetyltransferase)
MDVVMPQLGETVAEGKVSTWFKLPGDRVEAGENLFEIETDKVTMEVQALASGVLSEIRVKSGEVAPVGAVVAVIGDESVAQSPLPGPPPQGGREGASPSPLRGGDRGGGRTEPQQNGAAFKLSPFAETNTPTQNFGKASGPLGLKVTPLARRLIAQTGIDVSSGAERLKAKGAWRIGRAEVETLLGDGLLHASPLPGPPPQGGREAAASVDHAQPTGNTPGAHVAFNNIRRQTAERLAESWRTIPHAFQAVEVDFSAVDELRSPKKAEFATRHGISLTYLPFIARAVCLALEAFPHVNARLKGDGLAIQREINLGIAVDLAHKGLVVPVVRHADELSLTGLAKAIARQVEKARAGNLVPDDYSGGTYTISNNGSFGTLFTAPIINPPQVAILSVDAVRKKPVVIEGANGDSIAIRPVGIVGQSFDHRAFDGAYSAAFLAEVKNILETRDWPPDLA